MNRLFSKIKFVASSVKGNASIVEVVFWYIARICLLIAAIVDNDPLKKFIFASNFLACWAYTLLRIVAPKKSFISRSSFHLQTLIVFTSFAGYFIGHATDIHSVIDKYDQLLHLFSGVTMVLIGYYLINAMDKEKNATASIKAVASMGFSFLIIVTWEIFEFFCDYYIPDSENQAYTWNVPDNFFWFKIFGHPQAGAAQYPLMDTMIDMILAVITTIITTAILYKILRKEEKADPKPGDINKV